MLMEVFITAFKNVDLWIDELRIVFHVESSVNVSESPVHSRTSLLAELAMKDNYFV